MGKLVLKSRHRILCADSTSVADVSKLMNGDVAALVLTDPPYNYADEMSVGFYANCDSPAMKQLADAEWDKGFDITTFLACLSKFRPQDGTVYIFTSNTMAPAIWQWMRDEGASHSSYVVWCKPNPMPSLAKRHPTWATELICYGTFGKHTFNFPEQGHAISYWEINKNASNKLHTTQKPVAVMARAIQYSSNEGDIVLDGFIGGGTTIVASEQTGRRCCGLELNSGYTDVSVIRWMNVTGEQPILESTGETFDEVKARRAIPTPEDERTPVDADAELVGADVEVEA